MAARSTYDVQLWAYTTQAGSSSLPRVIAKRVNGVYLTDRMFTVQVLESKGLNQQSEKAGRSTSEVYMISFTLRFSTTHKDLSGRTTYDTCLKFSSGVYKELSIEWKILMKNVAGAPKRFAFYVMRPVGQPGLHGWIYWIHAYANEPYTRPVQAVMQEIWMPLPHDQSAMQKKYGASDDLEKLLLQARQSFRVLGKTTAEFLEAASLADLGDQIGFSYVSNPSLEACRRTREEALVDIVYALDAAVNVLERQVKNELKVKTTLKYCLYSLMSCGSLAAGPKSPVTREALSAKLAKAKDQLFSLKSSEVTNMIRSRLMEHWRPLQKACAAADNIETEVCVQLNIQPSKLHDFWYRKSLVLKSQKKYADRHDALTLGLEELSNMVARRRLDMMGCDEKPKVLEDSESDVEGSLCEKSY